MTVEAIDQTGAVLERSYRSQTSAVTAQSAWGSPVVEATAGADGAGNIPGQRFDFLGRGAGSPTRAGLFGNLGRLHVRNDRFNFYVGFEQAAIHPNQVIALFIENPAAPGVLEIGPLGNGAVDGDVDGLDLLDKLRFSNFRPSIGCLVGDEKADATLRSFQRPEMRWASGQGVFNLNAGFTSVSGARVQQFHGEPPGNPQFPEQNADYIEVAIPKLALGNPTNLIRLGAIVFSDAATGPMEPQFDTALAGKSFAASGDGNFVLEPMTITLAPDPNPFGDVYGFTGVWVSPSKIRFTWNSLPGANYWIQATPELGQAFVDVAGGAFPYTATEPFTAFDLDVSGLSAPRFFRLRTN
jgi:hypothetical protein